MSTAEAEVMAAVSAAKESIHLKLLLGELGVKQKRILIKEDNTACIAQAKGGLRFIRKAKHYDIALRFLQKLAVDGEVDFEYTETKEQLADSFTKALDEKKKKKKKKLIISQINLCMTRRKTKIIHYYQQNQFIPICRMQGSVLR